MAVQIAPNLTLSADKAWVEAMEKQVFPGPSTSFCTLCSHGLRVLYWQATPCTEQQAASGRCDSSTGHEEACWYEIIAPCHMSCCNHNLSMVPKKCAKRCKISFSKRTLQETLAPLSATYTDTSHSFLSRVLYFGGSGCGAPPGA